MGRNPPQRASLERKESVHGHWESGASLGGLSDVNERFQREGAAAGAAFFIEKIHNLAEGAGICGVPKVGAFAADSDEPNLFQLFQMMRERGGRNSELFLNFAGNHPCGVGGKEQTEDLQAGLSAERSKALCGAGHEMGIDAFHISMIAEIWKYVKSFFSANAVPTF